VTREPVNLELGKAAKAISGRAGSALLASLGPARAAFDIVAGAIEARKERARAQPISLDLALADGGLLDPAAKGGAPSEAADEKKPPAGG
jgi:hypothetical protein